MTKNTETNGNVNGDINGDIGGNIPADILDSLLGGDLAYYSEDNSEWYIMSQDEYWDYERDGGQWIYRPLEGWVNLESLVPTTDKIVRRLIAALSASDVVRPEVLETLPEVAQDLWDGRLVRYYPDDHAFRSILWSEHARYRACGLPGYHGVIRWMLPDGASSVEKANAIRLDRIRCREFETNIRWPEPPEPE